MRAAFQPGKAGLPLVTGEEPAPDFFRIKVLHGHVHKHSAGRAGFILMLMILSRRMTKSDGNDFIRQLLAGHDIKHVGGLPDTFLFHQAEEFQTGAADQNGNSRRFQRQQMGRAGLL